MDNLGSCEEKRYLKEETVKGCLCETDHERVLCHIKTPSVAVYNESTEEFWNNKQNLFSGKLDPISRKLDTISEELDPIYEELDPISRKLDTISEELHPISDEKDPISRQLDPVSRQLDPISRELEKNLNEFIKTAKSSVPSVLRRGPPKNIPATLSVISRGSLKGAVSFRVRSIPISASESTHTICQDVIIRSHFRHHNSAQEVRQIVTRSTAEQKGSVRIETESSS